MVTAVSPEMLIGQALLDDLDLDEVVAVEDASGVSISVMRDGGTVSFRFVVALAWVIRRRTEPEFTYEQAGKLKLRELADIFAPTPAAPLEPLEAKRRGSSAKSSQHS